MQRKESRRFVAVEEFAVAGAKRVVVVLVVAGGLKEGRRNRTRWKM